MPSWTFWPVWFQATVATVQWDGSFLQGTASHHRVPSWDPQLGISPATQPGQFTAGPEPRPGIIGVLSTYFLRWTTKYNALEPVINAKRGLRPENQGDMAACLGSFVEKMGLVKQTNGHVDTKWYIDIVVTHKSYKCVGNCRYCHRYNNDK